MIERAIGELEITREPLETLVKPYSWIGLALGLLALFGLTVVIFLGLVLLVFIAEIPVEGWHVMSDRVAWCYGIVMEGSADILIPQRLLIGALTPVTPRVVNGYLLVSMLPELSGIAAVCTVARFHAGSRWRDLLAWRSWSIRKNALVFVILLIVVIACNAAGGLIASHFAPEQSESLPSFGLTLVLSILESLVLAPFMEELVMRGWFYTALRTKLAAWPTIIVTAVIFAALHSGVSPGAVLATLPLGLAAGYLRERTGSVRATIAFHLLHNGAAVASLALH